MIYQIKQQNYLSELCVPPKGKQIYPTDAEH